MLLGLVMLAFQNSSALSQPITIGPQQLEERFSKETRAERQRLIRRVEQFNRTLPPAKSQTADDARRFVDLRMDLERAQQRAAWKSHDDLIVPDLDRPTSAAQEALRREITEELKRLAEEQEKLRQARQKDEELRLQAEQTEAQRQQAEAHKRQAEAQERQAQALERQASVLERQSFIMDDLRKNPRP
jgi:hypothetical protein